MAAVIIALERRRYTGCIVATSVGLLDWRTRCELVQLLLRQNATLLPPQLRQSDPAALVDEIPTLICTLAAPRSLLRQTTTAVFPT